jgi:hypothetical protein
MVDAERARRATGKTPGEVEVRQPPFPGGFEQEREALEQEQMKRFVETQDIDIFTPVGAQEVEKEQERIREITAAPRTPTGETEPIVDVAVDPVTNLAKAAVSFLGLEPVVEAMKPQEILSPAEYEQAERQFQADIDRYYNDYLNKIDAEELPLPEGIATYREFGERARSQQGYDIFREEFLKAGGPRGETLVRPVEEAGPALVQQGIMGLSQLGTVEEEDERGKLAVREGIVATALRDLMLPETFVAAAGQEAVEVFDDRIVEEKPFIRRWAENQRRAQGVEELSADVVETALNAAGIPEEDRQGLVDLAWWGGMGASLAMPLDAGLFTIAKGSSKLTSKAAKAAIKFPDAFREARAAVDGANPLLRAAGRAALADELALHPLDLRVRLGESLGGIDTYQKAAQELIYEGGFGKTLPKVFEGTLTKVDDLVEEMPTIVQGAARRARIRHGATDSVGQALKDIEEVDPDLFVGGDVTGVLIADPTNESLSIARGLLIDEVAQTLAGRAAKERILTGEQAFPADYTLITSRLAVPKETVNALLRRTRNNDFTTRLDAAVKAESEGQLFDIIEEMRAAGAPSSVLNRAKELISPALGDPQVPFSVIRRYLQDANIEMVAKQVAPDAVFDMAEILDIGEAALPRQADRAKFSRQTLENIDDLLTPEALRKSKVGKLLAKAKDFRKPPVNPVYKSLNQKLDTRIGNLDDEIVAKVDRLHDKGEPYILAVGRYLEEDLNTSPKKFGIKFLLANIGVADDVGTAFSSAGGSRGQALGAGQVPKRRLFNAILKQDGGTELTDIVDILSEFDEFTEEYWATLQNITTYLAGKRIDDLAGVEVDVLNDLSRAYAKANDVRFTFDPRKQDENIAGMVYARAREAAIEDFGRDVMNTMPEIFATKARIRNVFEEGSYALADRGGFQVSRRMLRKISGFFLGKYRPGYEVGVAKMVEEFTESSVFNMEEFALASIYDRVMTHMGIEPTMVDAFVRGRAGVFTSGLSDPARGSFAAGGADFFDIHLSVKRNLEDELRGRAFPFETTDLQDIIVAVLRSDKISNEIFSLMMLDDFSGIRSRESVIRELFSVEEALGKPLVQVDELEGYERVFGAPPVSPIEAAKSIPINIRTGGQELGQGVVDELTKNITNVIRFQRLDEAFKVDPNPGVLGPEDIEEVREAITAIANNMPDFPDGAVTRAQSLLGYAQGALNLGWDTAQNLSRNTVLGGAFVPNIPHLVMNALSAPAIMLSTIGFGKTLGALNPTSALQSVRTLSYLYSNRTLSFGLGYAMKPDGNKTVFIDKAGRGWTYDDLADAAVEGGITATRTTTEFRTAAYEELVSWTGKNFRELRKRGQNREAALRFLKATAEQVGFKGPSAFQDWADATDKFFRTMVLITELKAGRTVEEATALARASLFDYGQLPKSMKDNLAKYFWLYSFRTLNAATFIDNAINNPKRLVQAYKLKNAGYDYLDREDQTYYPFMGKYAEDRMWLSIYENPEARRRYALMGPQFPIIDAAQDIFDAAGFFVAMGQAAKSGDMNELVDVAASGIGGTLVGITNPVVERLIFTPAGLDVAFGEIMEATGYINPDFISYLAATGNLDNYIAIYNIQKVEPRVGKPTWHGYEYRVDPKDNRSKKAMLALQQNSILLGRKTYQDLIGDIASSVFYDEIGHYDPKVEGWNPVGRVLEKAGVVRAAELPTREDIERGALYQIRSELE